MSGLKEKVKEFAEIAASVPDNLQVSCFEILLRDYIASLSNAVPPKTPKGADLGPSAAPATTVPIDTSSQAATNTQADIAQADIHLKARKFMEKYSVSISELNNLFYKDGQTITPLYEDLKTTRMAEAQIRVTLLQALRSALVGGDFLAEIESVRTECRDRKTLDTSNFTANYRNNHSLFDFATFDKETKSVRLSEDGRKELSQLIKELQ